MKLQMQSIHFDADKKLTDYIQEKVDKLETFYDRIVDGEVIMKVEKDDQNQNKTIEFKINIPGEQLFVKQKDRTFEAATDQAIEALKRQIKRYKQKQRTR